MLVREKWYRSELYLRLKKTNGKEMQIVTAVLPGRQQFGMCKFCQQIHVGMENLASRPLLFGGMKIKSKINNSTCAIFFRKSAIWNIFMLCSWFHTFTVFWLFYVFFWVIPRRLNFICRRFGTLFHLHRRVDMKNDWVLECWDIYTGKVLARK
jgi:hypothetical protein